MANFQTLTVDPRNLHEAWKFAQRGIQDIIRKTSPDWIEEDIYAALKASTACMLLSFCDSIPIGFTVHYFSNTPFSNTKECFVWCAWTLLPRDRPTGLDVNGAVAATMQILADVAKREGCVQMMCISPRPGFTKWAAKHSFVQYHTTYRRPL